MKFWKQISAAIVLGAASAAFIPHVSAAQESAASAIREGFEEAIAGMFHLALMFRVGKAGSVLSGKEPNMCLVLGPNEVWNSRKGFTENGRNLLLGGRPIGSSNRN